ncbi:PREDICTED: steroid receptor RNA activator 1-like [Ceratosolen solmsi marchali]|uniref:Steroid receptor RNA activator 1-like n=1 Tax=Ceratosolen solmsi marchali TaxID=326594 RepID=A0AAJ6YH52_9HYME|nr:PREDICTED: steroid receptor RNA activator 1-like [Ceratosolen solmsi marchali]
MQNNPEVPSTQKKLLASHDPGWNDPPNWALSSLNKSDSGTPTKRLLNKRVAFPLNSKEEPLSSLLTQNFPLVGKIPPLGQTEQLTAQHKSTIASSAKVDDARLEVQISKDTILKDTIDNLQCLMKQLDSNKTEEIQKRLDRMQIMWNEDKLSKSVQIKLFEISEALKELDLEKVDQLHISLMTNNASVCGSWIPGIRQLITEIKNKKI